MIIDFEGFIDDIPFEGGKGENHSLKLGSGQFIPGFEEQLVGCSAGDDKDVEVNFPEEYQAEELAGKPAVFKTIIHEVKENVLPEIDDELAKDISEFETLDELKADIRAKMLETREKQSADAFESGLIDAMIATLDAEIPDVMIDRGVDRIISDYSYRLQMQGMTMENYMQMIGMDMEGFRKTFRPQAERQTKTQLALAEVIKAEAFEATDEEVDAEYARLAEEYKMEEENIRKSMPAEMVKDDIITKKAIECIKSNAVAVEPKPIEAAEAEEAKPVAKKRAPAKKKAAAEEAKSE